MVINTNISAQSGARLLAESSNALSKSLARLSSGSKIVSPDDDAAGLAVSMRFDAQINRIGAAVANVGNAVSFNQTQTGFFRTSAINQALNVVQTPTGPACANPTGGCVPYNIFAPGGAPGGTGEAPVLRPPWYGRPVVRRCGSGASVARARPRGQGGMPGPPQVPGSACGSRAANVQRREGPALKATKLSPRSAKGWRCACPDRSS